jgi:hypothetical protein
MSVRQPQDGTSSSEITKSLLIWAETTIKPRILKGQNPMKFTIRDVLLVTVIVALVLGWWLDRSRVASELERMQADYSGWKLLPDGTLLAPDNFVIPKSYRGVLVPPDYRGPWPVAVPPDYDSPAPNPPKP